MTITQLIILLDLYRGTCTQKNSEDDLRWLLSAKFISESQGVYAITPRTRKVIGGFLTIFRELRL